MGPDVLRIEFFGGLYYSRRLSEYCPLRPDEVRLLLSAREEDARTLLRQSPGGYPALGADRESRLGFYRDHGILDGDFRMRARVVQPGARLDSLSVPFEAHVHLTRACNLRCKHCFVDVMSKPSPDELTTPELDVLFQELAEHGCMKVVLLGGEPLIRRDIFEILEGAGRHGLDIKLCTNGTTIDEDEAARIAATPVRTISVSLDGPNAETHDSLRGRGRFDDACRGIRALVGAGLAERVQLRVTATRENKETLGAFGALASELGVARIQIKAFRATGGLEEARRLALQPWEFDAAIERARSAWAGPATLSVPELAGPRMPSWTRVMPAFSCVGGTVRVTVTHDGRAVACGAVRSREDWSVRDYGIVRAWREAPTIRAWRRFDGNPQCFACPESAVCGGGCRARAIAHGRGPDGPDPFSFCAGRSELGPFRQHPSLSVVR